MKRRIELFPSVLTLALAASFQCFAADLTWDTAATAGVQGGAGTWDTATTNWTTDAGATRFAWDNTTNALDTALFTTGTGRVTLAENISLLELRISSTNTSTIGGRANTNYVFDGPGSLQFGSQQGILDTTGSGLVTSQINNNLIGSGGLIVKATGASTGNNGWLSLAGNNAGLSAGIRIDSGLLGVVTSEALGTNIITLNGGGLFTNADRSGAVATTITGPTNLHFANDIVVNNVAGNLIRVWGSRNAFFTGTVSGDGGFNKADVGSAFIRSSSLTSAITISGGALWLNQLNNGGQITISAFNTLGYLGGSETTDRIVNFSTGNGGVITAHGDVNFTSNMTGTASPMAVVIGGGGAASMNGISTGALINFVKGGLGIWTVNGGITPGGTTPNFGNIRMQGGILAFSATSLTTGNAIIGTASSGRTNGGVVRFATGSSIKTASANTSGGILGGWATFDNTTWAKTNGSGNAIDGFTAFTDDSWAAGTNTNVTLAGADPGSGSTTHSLRFNAAGAKTLTLSGTNTLTSGGLMVTANVGANTTTISGGTLVGANTSDLVIHQYNTAGSLTIGSIIANNTGATGLTKTGAGSVLLTGANTYTGTTRVFEGTLSVTDNNGAKIYEVGSQGRLEIGYAIGEVTGYGVTVNGAGLSSTNGLALDGGKTYSFQSTLRLAGAPTTVRSYGSGNATLGGFSSGTHLNVENTASGSVIAPTVTFDGLTSGYVMNIDQGLNTATGDITIQGILTGSTGFQKTGLGSVRLDGTGSSSNTGAFDVRAGALILAGSNNRLGAGSSVILGNGSNSGQLALNGVNQTLTALTSSGTGTDNRVVGGSATLSTLTINNATDSALAPLGGSGTHHNNLALTKTGAGVLTLASNSTYTGDTTVSGGTLALTTAFLANASTVRITGATLNLTHSLADTIDKLFINGVQQAAGTYNSVNTPSITGTGSLLVTSGPSGDTFATWASAAGLDGTPGKEAGFNDDPDRDGFANGLEWILGGNPLNGSSGSLITTTASAAGGLTLTFTRNEDSVGIATLAVEYSATLAAPWASAAIGATSSGPDANGVTVTINTASTPDAVTVTVPASNAPAGKLFGRLKATQP